MVNLQDLLRYSKDLTVLYVEDHKETQKNTKDLLDNLFGEVITAQDGIDGLEKFHKYTVDLVMSDIDMPRMNGLEMVRSIREENMEVVILILSAYNDSKYFMDSIRYGVDGYLLKPVERKQFMFSIYKAVENIHHRKESLKYKCSLETKLKDQEQLLLLQSRMACMGGIIDSVAHQWKQPLNIINMSAEMITYDMVSKKDEVKQSAENILNQVEHMVSTLDEFRKFLRPNNHIEVINMNQLFKSIHLLMKDELLKHSVVLEIIASEDICIQANKNDIKHLFINLVNNAKDEMVKNNIEASQRIVTIKCYREDTHVIMLVRDNGRGVPPDIQESIFDANFTTKKESGGTGIGLFMSKQIVTKHHGTIETYNEGGAVFKITMDNVACR